MLTNTSPGALRLPTRLGDPSNLPSVGPQYHPQYEWPGATYNTYLPYRGESCNDDGQQSTLDMLSEVVSATLVRKATEWQRIKNQPGAFHTLVLRRINIGRELLQMNVVGDRMRTELCARPEIVAKYSRLAILEFCDDFLRWTSISRSLDQLKLLEKTAESKKYSSKKARYRYMHDITLAFRDILARTCHKAYLTIGKLPEWKSCIHFSGSSYFGYQPWLLRFDITRHSGFPNILQHRESLRGQIARTLSHTIRLVPDSSSLRCYKELRSIAHTMTPTARRKLGVSAARVLADLVELEGTLAIFTQLTESYGLEDEVAFEGPDTWEDLRTSRRREHTLIRYILNSARFESFITKLGSLYSKSVLRRIWAQLDERALKIEKLSFDQVLDIATPIPDWTHKPGITIPPEVGDHSDSSDKSREDENVKFALLCNAISFAFEPEEASDYQIGPREYETIYRLLKSGHTIDWVDFERVMFALGFSKTPRSGSVIHFRPPAWAKARPFIAHRPHGSEIPPYKVRALGSDLKSQYGWRIEWFSAMKPESEEKNSRCHRLQPVEPLKSEKQRKMRR